MTPWAVLGIARDATTADIKRAYAALVKKHRPDEDAARFQQIHEAFEACLARARTTPQLSTRAARVPVGEAEEVALAEGAVATPPRVESPPGQVPTSWDEDDADDYGLDEDDDLDDDYLDDLRFDPQARTPRDEAPDADAAGRTRPAPVRIDPPHERFDVDGFVAEYRRQSVEQRAEGLTRWLDAQPALYSIELKQRIVGPLMAKLHAEAPLRPFALQALLRFFDLDTVGRGKREQYGVDELQRRSAELFGWEDLSFMDKRPRQEKAPASSSSGEVPWRLIFFGLWMVAHLARCAGS
jgi:hypothetical protein